LQRSKEGDIRLQKIIYKTPFLPGVDKKDKTLQIYEFKNPRTAYMHHKNKKDPTFTFKPKYLQVQAAIYLGTTRISCFAYSEPTPVVISMRAEDTIKFDKSLSFFKTLKKGQGVRDEEEFDIDVLSEEWYFEPLLTRMMPS